MLSSRALQFALLIGVAAIPSLANGQVLEIRDDGSVVSYAGPNVHTDTGAQQIAPPEAAAHTASPPAEVARLLEESATRHAVPLEVVQAVAWQESRFNSRAISPKGAVGVMQLMPGTARDLGIDPTDTRGNIDGGTAYLSRQLRRFGDLRLALAAYNAGPEAVARHGGVPPYAETQNYVRAILARLHPAGASSSAFVE